jgi:hypothetical protein
MRDDRGSALVVAVLALALAGALAASLAELGRLALVRARLDQWGVRAWFVAEGGLAETVGGLEPGTDFDALLEAPAEEPGADAGPWSYRSAARDDADEEPDDPLTDTNQRVLLRITAFGPPPVRRRLEALVGRAAAPYLPAAAMLGGGVRELTRDFLLDGRDFDVTSGCTFAGGGAARAGLSLPEDAVLPALGEPTQILGKGDAPSITRLAAPDLTPLGDAEHGEHVAPGALAGVIGTPGSPRFTVVDGDARIDGALTGAGTLFVNGQLEVRGTLAFTGLVAAAAGVHVTAAGTLAVCGALWASGEPALGVRGVGAVRTSVGAIEMAARVAPLPAAPEILAVRELF